MFNSDSCILCGNNNLLFYLFVSLSVNVAIMSLSVFVRFDIPPFPTTILTLVNIFSFSRHKRTLPFDDNFDGE